MGLALNTLGVTVSYCVETTSGTRPTTGYTEIPDIKEVPEMNSAPEALDATTLKETEYKTYVSGLKDLGGALTFTANYTNELLTVWNALMTAYKEGAAAKKATWFEIKHPQLTEAVYFTGQPTTIGIPAMSVNAVLETSLYIIPTNEPKNFTKGK